MGLYLDMGILAFVTVANNPCYLVKAPLVIKDDHTWGGDKMGEIKKPFTLMVEGICASYDVPVNGEDHGL
jgi:hypothetical protein